MSKVTPVQPTRGALRPLGLDEVRITGGYWGGRQETNAAATIGHCLHWLEELGWIANFDKAAAGGAFDRAGREFSDSEIYKLAEAMAWEIGRTGSAELEDAFQRLTGRIAAAQRDDGYLSTCFGNPGQAPRYSNLDWGHELYCYGHLIQAAVARLRTRGEDRFTDVARKVADHVCEVFGPGGMERICGHAEIEVALAEFARATGDDRYLEQARLFIERHGRETGGAPGREYDQDDVPVREAEVLRGHAVRALYLSSGAIDVAVDTGDDELLDAVRRQWARTLARRTHVTGGMGSRYIDEAFGSDFSLPPDRAYAESCAGVGAVMTAWRLLLATGEASYADMIERVSWNVLAGAVSPEGTSFFYANPLHQRTADAAPPPDRALPHHHAGGRRAPWFDVSCCPTNLARTFASLAAYVATADDEGLQIHQYTPCTIDTVLGDGSRMAVSVATDFPDSGSVTVRVLEADGASRTIVLRVPSWADEAVLTDPSGAVRRVGPGGASVTHAFTEGDVVRLELPVVPKWIRADPRIDGVRGCAAVQRGPVVLCAESVDLPDGADVVDLTVDASAAPVERDGRVYVSGHLHHRDDGWPYSADADGVDKRTATEFALVPYHARAGRGAASMRVWMPAE